MNEISSHIARQYGTPVISSSIEKDGKIIYELDVFVQRSSAIADQSRKNNGER